MAFDGQACGPWLRLFLVSKDVETSFLLITLAFVGLGQAMGRRFNCSDQRINSRCRRDKAERRWWQLSGNDYRERRTSVRSHDFLRTYRL